MGGQGQERHIHSRICKLLSLWLVGFSEKILQWKGSWAGRGVGSVQDRVEGGYAGQGTV